MARIYKLIQFSVLLALYSATAVAESYFDFYGQTSLEFRAFEQAPLYDNQENGTGFSVSFEPEFFYEFDNYKDSIKFKPFLRFDPQDSSREHFDVRELYWEHSAETWYTRVGINTVSWGVAESNHLVDIINQTDFVESPDGEEKLGQTMVQLGIDREWGHLSFFVLPGFQERTFPSKEGRLRTFFHFDTDQTKFITSEEDHIDFAVRYEKVLDNFDFGISHFSGISREPSSIETGLNAAGENVLIPVYDKIDQTGIDIQYTQGSWLFKFEGYSRSGQGERFEAFVAGFEYTFFDIMNSGADLGLLAEYSEDNRDDSVAMPSLYDNDSFVGFRYAMNNIDDLTILGGALVDNKSKFRSYIVEAETRIGDNFESSLEARFNAGAGKDLELGLENEDYIGLTISYYF